MRIFRTQLLRKLTEPDDQKGVFQRKQAVLSKPFRIFAIKREEMELAFSTI